MTAPANRRHGGRLGSTAIRIRLVAFVHRCIQIIRKRRIRIAAVTVVTRKPDAGVNTFTKLLDDLQTFRLEKILVAVTEDARGVVPPLRPAFLTSRFDREPRHPQPNGKHPPKIPDDSAVHWLLSDGRVAQTRIAVKTPVPNTTQIGTHVDSPIPWDVALHIAYQTAQALEYAHHAADDQGEPLEFVHRDMRPANILLTRTGHVKLTDFGIATVRSRAPTTEDGQVRGKLGYMSAEQVLGKELSGKSDVFTLSTVLAEMLIGEPLFQGESELNVLLQIRDADLRVLARCERRIPQDIRAVVLRGLQRDPKERPTAGAFAEACAEVMRRRDGSRARSPRPLARPAQLGRRRSPRGSRPRRGRRFSGR